MISIEEYFRSLCDLAVDQGYSIQEMDDSAKTRLVAIQRSGRSRGASPFRLYLSAGIHGDEPAGPLALLSLLEDNSLPEDIDIVICPLINPTGIATGTRENKNGHDLNRDFRYPLNVESKAVVNFLNPIPHFDLSICLHEDWESSGFYLYALSPDSDRRIPIRVLNAVAQIGPIDLSPEIDGSPSEAGLIQRPMGLDLDARDDWPEAFYLYSKSPHLHLTTESPSSFPIAQRIEMQKTAILTAIRLCRAHQPL